MSETSFVILAAIVSLWIGVGIGAWACWTAMKPFREFHKTVIHHPVIANEEIRNDIRDQINRMARIRGQR